MPYSMSDAAVLIDELVVDGQVVHPKNPDMLYWVDGRRERSAERIGRLRTFLASYRQEGGDALKEYELRILDRVSGCGNLADMTTDEWRGVCLDLMRLSARMHYVASHTQK